MTAADMAKAERRGGSGWDKLLAEGTAYIEAARDPEISRIVLLDGPTILGDSSLWPSQNACLAATMRSLETWVTQGAIKPVPIEAAARLLNGAALHAALWIASSEAPGSVLKDAVATFEQLASGLLTDQYPGPRSTTIPDPFESGADLAPSLRCAEHERPVLLAAVPYRWPPQRSGSSAASARSKKLHFRNGLSPSLRYALLEWPVLALA